MRDITKEEKNAIRNMVVNGTGGVLFKMPNFDEKMKARSMITNAAAWGDLGHFLGHGITFGGIFHQINREGNWQELARQVYERGISKGLHCYKWSPRLKKLQNEEQVVIAGATYFSVYMRGETYRKEIYYKRIVKLEYFPNLGLEIILKNSKGNYESMMIYSIFDNMIGLMETILRFTLRAHFDPIYGDLVLVNTQKVQDKALQNNAPRTVPAKTVNAVPTPAPTPVSAPAPMPAKAITSKQSKRSELIALLAQSSN